MSVGTACAARLIFSSGVGRGGALAHTTWEVFDRQASHRRSLINTDTVSRRPKKVNRRKTISGLPDNFAPELAAKGRGGELRPHSMFIPGQYSTLGRVGSVNSALRRSVMRDSGCQTEDAVKVTVPPSMRRIRAQRGQGIAAQMAGISNCSSTGSISVSGSDASSGVLVLPPAHHHLGNGDVSRFHSLPRQHQGARVSLSADPLYSSTPVRPADGQSAPRGQIGRLQADDTVVHMRTAPRPGTLPRPKSQEVRGTRAAAEWGGGPACVVSPHATYSISYIPNATMSCSTEVIALHGPGQHRHHSPAFSTMRPLSLASSTTTECSLASSATDFTHSSAGPAMATSTPMHAGHRGGPGPVAPSSESGRSDSSTQSHSTLAPTPPSSVAEEQWIYDTPENVVAMASPRRPLTSSCSTPIGHTYSSMDLSSRTTTDSSSLYSQDNDGYYTSMHQDSGLRSHGDHLGRGGGGSGGRATRHSMYECREVADDGASSVYSDRSLSRSISLRKSKKPPLPPARTDSLRRQKSAGGKKPLGGVSAVGGAEEMSSAVLNETLIASLQQSLQRGLRGGKGGKGASPSSPSQSPCSDYDDPWVLRPRSHSSISITSSSANGGGGVPNVYSLCHVTPAQSETSSLRSDYAESWGYYMEYPRDHGDHGAQQTPPSAHSAGGNASAEPHLGEQQQQSESGRGVHSPTLSQASVARGQDEVVVSVKPKTLSSSPDRVHRLTSPSSGYSSQSNTPTAGTPVPSCVRSTSPAGSRPKPKVPERKSSLLSSVSVSSSSTSLSSNTSDSLRNSGPPLPLPLILPPLLLTSSSSAPNTPLTPPPPFPAPLPPNSCPSSPPPPPPPAPPLPSTPHRATLSPPPPPCSASPEFPPPPSPESFIHPSSQSFNGSVKRSPGSNSSTTTSTAPSSTTPFPTTHPRIWEEDAKALIQSPTKQSLETKPLITAFALQSIQLRSVKRPEKQINGMVDSGKSNNDNSNTAAADLVRNLKAKNQAPVPKEAQEPGQPGDVPLLNGLTVLSYTAKDCPPPVSPVSKLLEELSIDCSGVDGPLGGAVLNGMANCNDNIFLNGKVEEEVEKEQEKAEAPLPRLPAADQGSPAKQKPPVVSKKPKLSFIIPATSNTPPDTEPGPVTPQPREETLWASLPMDEMDEMDGVDEMDGPRTNTKQEAMLWNCEQQGNAYGERERPLPGSSPLPLEVSSGPPSTDTQQERPKLSSFDPAQQETGSDPGAGANVVEEEEDATSNSGSTTSSKDEDNDRREEEKEEQEEVEEEEEPREITKVEKNQRRAPNCSVSLGGDRSKRKVLGRRESDEEKSRGGSNSQSPPLTPTAQSPTPSDNFKALLLRKGSRSETGFRMSAAEMLRSTDPRFQRTRSDSVFDSPLPSPTSPHSPAGSPLGGGRAGKRAPDEWNRHEGLLPLCSPSSPTSPLSSSPGGMKSGRSRMPPSAASSKYNARRLLSSPMTVICEREGELAESEAGEGRPPCESHAPPSSRCSPPAYRLPQPQTVNGTLSEDNSS
ncbi:hypothetical protein CRUP_023571 [Coryphaenoides rupestris]|nr:hypothetical protein CRUP_023571 [Coryphaenoides rupestris]